MAYYAAYFTEEWRAMRAVCQDCEAEVARGNFNARWAESARGASSSVTWLEVINGMERPHPNPQAEKLIKRFALALVKHKLGSA